MATEIRVCFKNHRKDSWLIVGTDDVNDAMRIGKTWGERTENGPVTQIIVKQRVPTPRGRPELLVDGTTVWPPRLSQKRF